MKSLKLTAYKAPLELVEEPTPQPSGAQVLLRVRAAGVCHSDLHLHDGGYDLGNGRILSLRDRGVTLPRTLGHETVGEVVGWGDAVTDLAVGDLRLIYPWIGCGECPACLRGDENLCIGAPRVLGVHRDGGFADHILVPHPRYLVDLQGIAPEAAAPLACSGLTAYAAVRKVREVAMRKPVVLIGAGGVGQTAIGLLRAIGAVGAVVVDISADKRASAAAAGALATFDANVPDVMAQVQAAVGCTPLANAVARLNEGLARYVADPTDTQIRDGLIQRFEFTYDLSHKMLRRAMEEAAANPADIDRMTFPALIRTGVEQGLVAGEWA